MNKLFYPAIFHTAEESRFRVSFPDLPECLTEGDDMQDAYEMAVEALWVLFDRKRKKMVMLFPEPTEINKIDIEDGVLVIVEFNMLEYQKKHNSRAVKKTLRIPEWLNEEAVNRGVNFSQLRGSVNGKIKYWKIKSKTSKELGNRLFLFAPVQNLGKRSYLC